MITAVLLGPWYGVNVAFLTSLMRNIFGTGSLLAFPGSMIGAFLAGILYKKTKRMGYAMVGEVLGTGILGAIVSYPVSKYLIGKEATLFFFVGPFILSSFIGAIIGYSLIKIILKKTGGNCS